MLKHVASTCNGRVKVIFVQNYLLYYFSSSWENNFPPVDTLSYPTSGLLASQYIQALGRSS